MSSRKRIHSSALLASLFAAGLCAIAAPRAGTQEIRDNRDEPKGVLVAFKPQTEGAQRLSALRSRGLQADSAVQSPYFVRVPLTGTLRAEGVDAVSLARSLAADPSVRVAEPDWIYHADDDPNDTRFSELWGLKNTGQTINGVAGQVDADIDADVAWGQTTGSHNVVVAVIDTGVDYNHPDLTNNILLDNMNAVVGFDFVDNDADPFDENHHGTHCSGTIGAEGNNNQGVIGVSPTVSIMPMRFLDENGSGSNANAILAIDYARVHGAQIMSNSWGGGAPSQLMLEAIQRANDAGILFVASAGNDSTEQHLFPSFPAGYNRLVPNVISVAASTNLDQPARFTNFGADTVDIAAPGFDILSTFPNSDYQYLNGTSMACPHVSGAAALIRAKFPTITVQQLKYRLLANADRVPGLLGLVRTGRLNIGNALSDDATPPAKPKLKAGKLTDDAAQVSWPAVADGGVNGNAAFYDLRISTQVITESNFNTAPIAPVQPVEGFPLTVAAAPAEPAIPAVISGLQPSTKYFLGLRAVDHAGNASPVATLSFKTAKAKKTLLSDGAEGTPQFTGTGSWAAVTGSAHTGTHFYSDSPNGNYPNNNNTTLTLNNPLKLPSNSDCCLNFWVQAAVEYKFDFLYVEVLPANQTQWIRLPYSVSDTFTWRHVSIPLEAFAGETIGLRFRLVTDNVGTADGVSLDDITVLQGGATSTPLSDDAEGTPKFTGAGGWAVSTELASSGTHCYTDSPGTNSPAGGDLSLTQASAVSIPAAGVPFLYFQASTNLFSAFDDLIVEVSADNGVTWIPLTLVSNPVAQFRSIGVPLSAFRGKSLKSRFRLKNGPTGTRNGVWLDDIRIVVRK